MDRNKLWQNSRLVQNLNTYFNEDRISDSITQLKLRIHQIESVTGPSKRTSKMRAEISKLELELSYCREQAGFRTRRFRASA